MSKKWVDEILQDASVRYGIRANNLKRIGGGFENKMYGHNNPKNRFVMRITPPGHKIVNEVLAELDWLMYLYENGAPVEKVRPSINGQAVEVISHELGEIPVVCWEWAPGQLVKREDFTPELFQTWGKAVGKMHTLTKDYEKPSNPIGRIQWYEDEYLARKLIPTDQHKVLERFDELIGYFRSLPKTKDSFGLIHQDVHHGNLFLDGTKITVLDFDDCVYGHFVIDIANALGFAIWEKSENMDNTTFASVFLEHFLKGYEEENHLEEFWLEQLPRALKLFEFIHYNAFCMDHDLAGDGSFDKLDAKTQDILTRYRNSIENNLPYIENTFCPYR
ncbi:MAG: phosphotransferase enzyme family protein [Candidatus Thorarchaeota archaeon]